MPLNLDILGVKADVACDDPGVLDELSRDFAAFRSTGEAEPEVAVTLTLASPPADPLAGAICRAGRGFRWAEKDGVRRVDYEGRALAVFEASRERLSVTSTEPELLRELGYLAVCSRAGWRLDMRGFHRLHALGVERGGKAALLMLDSGGGKSSIALELLRRGSARLLSEDTPVLGPDGRLHPFALRLGLRPDADLSDITATRVRSMARREHGLKKLVDLDHFPDAVAGAVVPSVLVAGRPGGRRCELRRAPFATLPPLFTGMVIGLGLPQLAEFLWPRGASGWAGLAAVAARRAVAAARLWSGCRTYEMRLGPDPARSAAVLAELLDSSEKLG
ncbi:MAG: hypothetical protein A2V88_00010 [Elusimicrobia bacterium RBG_16_66_12]|nr:MAG: hypothetical protein A2V88_00010 [Elusimicrobia bacterium RBG_16_66_12]